ncbi:hypothetical protein UPYG_G00294240 [Umbra pygmaea]|uniref:Uncharacterized protein n=1 Tax=Umbra pygmaea TaxID=75934 RepID=A0ABD0W9H5_UMBPY
MMQQPEFVLNQKTQVPKAQSASPTRTVSRTDVSLDNIDIPDAELSLTLEPEGERGLESGVEVTEDEGSKPKLESAKRVKKPVVRLSYDELGNPCDQPLTVLSHGVLLAVELAEESRRQRRRQFRTREYGGVFLGRGLRQSWCSITVFYLCFLDFQSTIYSSSLKLSVLSRYVVRLSQG